MSTPRRPVEVIWDGTRVIRVPPPEQVILIEAMSRGLSVRELSKRLQISDDVIHRRTALAASILGTYCSAHTLYEMYRIGLIPVPRDPNCRGRLSGRQANVLELASRLGLTNAQIATRLGISHGTVESHMRNIFDILDAKSRPQALRQATVRGDIRVKVYPQVWRGLI